jgi:para-nitrobenzyl esterase
MAALALVLVLFGSAAQAAEPVLHVTGGDLMGDRLPDASYVFHAVPFAAPPVGDLRWRAPQDVVAWSGVRHKTDSAPACLQIDYGWQTDMAAKSSEDCLYLEVRTPDLRPQKPLPVMVYIHGGANRAGGGAGAVMAGFAAKGVVIVSLQYRLGVFGFLSHPALSREQGGASGNYALMDQIKALEWVRDNIAQFGGDSGNVTIFGQSAGSEDVGMLLVAPAARGLFQKAIEESGPPQFGLPPRTLAQNEAMGVDLAKVYTDAAPDSDAALAVLRRVPARRLQYAGDRLPVPVADDSFIWLQAVVDGRVLTEAPQDAFRKGDQAKSPLIIGTIAQEIGLFGGSSAVPSEIVRQFGDHADDAMRFYGMTVTTQPPADPLYGDVAMQLSTDLMMRCPSNWVAQAQTQAGAPAFVYQLDVNNGDGPPHHSSDLAFVMNPQPAGKTDAQWPRLLDYWTQFAKTGDPNRADLANWPSFGADGRYIEFSTSGPLTRDHQRAPLCQWRDTP